MKLWRALSPLPTIAALVVIAGTCALGNWQLNRAHEKVARAARLEALASQPALEIGLGLVDGVVAERRVHVRGRFDAAHTVLLDNRPHGNGTDSRAGFMVLTALRVAGGEPSTPAVLVLRGWLTGSHAYRAVPDPGRRGGRGRYRAGDRAQGLQPGPGRQRRGRPEDPPECGPRRLRQGTRRALAALCAGAAQRQRRRAGARLGASGHRCRSPLWLCLPVVRAGGADPGAAGGAELAARRPHGGLSYLAALAGGTCTTREPQRRVAVR
ncbi:cytochrome oxidase assembly protein, SurF [Cupriavidus basilensis OR16]|uniref:SURF1-like protein n=1 Tax=Cupriavidus basilensis OR16 TaxID=1127483 RepID=H1S7S0_9BURK|nr:cytochrome oxidase assembly protein, SurF [Cupriavidus basilensis OR16]